MQEFSRQSTCNKERTFPCNIVNKMFFILVNKPCSVTKFASKAVLNLDFTHKIVKSGPIFTLYSCINQNYLLNN